MVIEDKLNDGLVDDLGHDDDGDKDDDDYGCCSGAPCLVARHGCYTQLSKLCCCAHF